VVDLARAQVDVGNVLEELRKVGVQKLVFEPVLGQHFLLEGLLSGNRQEGRGLHFLVLSPLFLLSDRRQFWSFLCFDLPQHFVFIPAHPQGLSQMLAYYSCLSFVFLFIPQYA